MSSASIPVDIASGRTQSAQTPQQETPAPTLGGEGPSEFEEKYDEIEERQQEPGQGSAALGPIETSSASAAEDVGPEQSQQPQQAGGTPSGSEPQATGFSFNRGSSLERGQPPIGEIPAGMVASLRRSLEAAAPPQTTSLRPGIAPIPPFNQRGAVQQSTSGQPPPQLPSTSGVGTSFAPGPSVPPFRDFLAVPQVGDNRTRLRSQSAPGDIIKPSLTLNSGKLAENEQESTKGSEISPQRSSVNWTSGEPITNPSGPKRYTPVRMGQTLELRDTARSFTVGLNEGTLVSSGNKKQLRVPDNESLLEVRDNQRAGHVAVTTNSAVTHFVGNQGTATVIANNDLYVSEHSRAGAEENIISNNKNTLIADSAASHSISTSSAEVSLGYGNRTATPGESEPVPLFGRPAAETLDQVPLQENVPERPNRQAGLVGEGKLVIQSHLNGTVTQHYEDGTIMHRLYPQGQTHEPDGGKSLELNRFGKPSFFNPLATHQAGKKFETYVKNPYLTAGGLGIFLANSAGFVSSAATGKYSLAPAGSPAATPTPSAGSSGVSSGAADDVTYSTPLEQVRTAQATPDGQAPASTKLQFDKDGLPIIETATPDRRARRST